MSALQFLLTVVLIGIFSSPVAAEVGGDCGECHVMHSSQDGGAVGTRSYGGLLFKDCLECHTGTNTGTNTIPYVYCANEPIFGTNTLAGGSFFWVKTQDAKGHNIFPGNADDILTEAPGKGSRGCGVAGDCHRNLHEEVDHNGLRQGCGKCHMVTDAPVGSFHHADDSNLVVGGEANDSDGFFRFLAGHDAADGKGVSGIEDPKWGYGADTVRHNEYLGSAGGSGAAGGLKTLGHTMTGFCCGCHGDFHGREAGGSWLGHPSDAVLPAEGEYASYTTYEPMVPVARSVLTGVSGTVTPGTDMVMCLSCHVAHGSPYNDMLRWDYSEMRAGGQSSGGCLVCHAGK